MRRRDGCRFRRSAGATAQGRSVQTGSRGGTYRIASARGVCHGSFVLVGGHSQGNWPRGREPFHFLLRRRVVRYKVFDARMVRSLDALPWSDVHILTPFGVRFRPCHCFLTVCPTNISPMSANRSSSGWNRSDTCFVPRIPPTGMYTPRSATFFRRA